jgi:hypothetical protein
MPDKVDKLIITNFAALNRKYQSGGLNEIRAGIDRLIQADKQRGLDTQVLGLDNPATLQGLSVSPVSNAADPNQNKSAIDSIYRVIAPDYIMLLGATDIVPHQDLKNPLYTGANGDDPDAIAYGDIPYACEAPYNQSAQNFMGPTRVVGRLPDVTGAIDPAYLVGVLDTAADWQTVERNAITDYFAITAEIWDASTRLSTTNVFGTDKDLQNVPPDNSQWAANLLARPLHFFNCHGAAQSPQFYGQPKSGAPQYPIALDASYIGGKIYKGAIAAAECCYGGQLYPLSQNVQQMGICNTYLANTAYGFWGSTTIAYGPSEGNGQADLICQYFLDAVLAGASLGRAALEARQKFIRSASPPDPSDIKTLAQYNLYGDPSITPVSAGPGPAGIVASQDGTSSVLAERIERHDRRRALFKGGLALGASEPRLRRRRKVPDTLLGQLQAAVRDAGFAPAGSLSFEVHHRARPRMMPEALVETGQLPSAYHVLFARRTGAERQHDAPPMPQITLFIAKEVDGRLASIAKLHSR